MNRQPGKIGLIACEAMQPELRAILHKYPNVAYVEFHKLGLHDNPGELNRTLQQSIDYCEANDEIQIVALGYGLCCKSIEGLATRRCELVIPRVHDCRAIILGSRRGFEEYESGKPGAYWFSPGWLTDRQRAPSQEKFQRLLAEYTQKYGPDNAEYLLEVENDWVAKYSRAVYVDTGSSDVEEYRKFTRKCAAGLGWEYDELSGSADLVEALLGGCWNEDDFLVIQPGHTPRMTDDERIFIAVARG